MNTTVRGLSPILDGYLDELDAATAHLPADEAYEIRSSVEDHIVDHLDHAAHKTRHVDDDDARRIVRDLGPVSSIVPTTSLPTLSPRPAFAANTPQAPEPVGRMGHVAAGCGIAGLVLFPLVPVSVALGLMALILGIIAVRRRQQRGFAIAGIVLGVIAGIVIPLTFIGLFAVTEDGGSGGSSTKVTSYPASPAYDAP